MLTVKVLGPTNPHSHKVERHARAALGWIGLEDEFELVKVTEPDQITAYVERTPSLVINDEVVCEGRIPAINEVMSWMANRMHR